MMNSPPGAHTFDHTPVAVRLAVFDSLGCPQVHGAIFPQKNGTSMGEVFTTARFEAPTLENKGRNKGHPIEKRRFSPRTAKDGLKTLERPRS